MAIDMTMTHSYTAMAYGYIAMSTATTTKNIYVKFSY